MTLVDSNVWLALAISKHQFHTAAQDWLTSLGSSAPVHFCRATQQSFLRLLTTRAVLALYALPPLTNRKAWSIYERFRADTRIVWADEPHDLDAHWQRLAVKSQSSPKLWMDAYLAAFAIAGRYRFVTTDQAFLQFKGLDALILSKRLS